MFKKKKKKKGAFSILQSFFIYFFHPDIFFYLKLPIILGIRWIGNKLCFKGGLITCTMYMSDIDHIFL